MALYGAHNKVKVLKPFWQWAVSFDQQVIWLTCISSVLEQVTVIFAHFLYLVRDKKSCLNIGIGNLVYCISQIALQTQNYGPCFGQWKVSHGYMCHFWQKF